MENSSSIDLGSVQAELKNTLQFLYLNFIKTDASSAVPALDSLLALADANLSNETASDSNAIVNSIDFRLFDSAYGAFTVANTNTSQLYTSSNGTYAAVNASASLTTANDANASVMLKSSTATNASKLLNVLDNLKIAYQLCDDAVFYNYTSDARGMVDPSYNVIRSYLLQNHAVPTAQQRTLTQVNAPSLFEPAQSATLNAYRNNALLKFIYTADPSIVDLFVLRRIILGTFYALHFRLFLALFVDSYVPSTRAYDAVAAKGLTLFYDKLRKLNTEYENDLRGKSATTLMGTLQTSVQQYNTDMSQLNGLSDDIKTSKRALKSRVDYMAAQGANAAAAQKFRLAALVGGALLVAALLATAATPFGLDVKLKVTAAVLGVALAFAVLLTFFKRRSVAEHFSNTFLPGGTKYADLLDRQLTKIVMRDVFDLVVTSELSDFYSNTGTLAMALKNNTLYNTLIDSQQRELVFFNDASSRIDTAVAGADAAGRVQLAHARVSSAVFAFVLLLILLVAIAVFGVLATEQLPILRVLLLCLVGVAALFLVLRLARALLAPVRTSPGNLYWGTPAAAAEL
jgi:hypothetical protein